MFVLGALALLLLAVSVIGSGKLFAAHVRAVMFFGSSIKGLTAGSPVVFRGVPIGRVSSIRMSGNVDSMEFFIPVQVELDASVLKDMRHTADSAVANADGAYLRKMVQNGLCARLNSQSLLTGQLLIELDVFPDVGQRGTFMPMSEYDALPVIPTIPSQFEAIWQRFAEMPIDKLVQNFTVALANMNEILESLAVKDVSAILSETRAILETTRMAMQSFSTLSASLAGMVDRQVPDALDRVRRLLDAYAGLAVQLENSLEGMRGVVGPNTVSVVEFNRAVREIGEAAKAVRSLAGILERNPEALLLGKGADRR